MKMNFRTVVEPGKSNFQISHHSSALMMGSCFSENIGHKLAGLKFQVDLNPFGVLFNPLSIAKSLERLLAGNIFAGDELFFYNDSWHSFMHHSRFSSPDKNLCLQQINERITNSSEGIEKLDFLIITFGTVWTFFNINDGEPVSNCHKLPARNFERRLLEIPTIVETYKHLFLKLKEKNSGLKIILTVSPVRHLGDGAHENQVSKSILLLAVHELCKLQNTEYFPAYEIMLDDLRDYRFYKSDLAHPSDEAVEYIFEKFSNAYFSNETLKLNNEIESIIAASKHRPVNCNSGSFQQFKKNTLEKISLLRKPYPMLDFSEEINLFNNFV